MSRSLGQAVRWAEQVLAGAGVESARTDALLLAGHLLGLSRGEVEARAVIGADEPAGYAELVAQRARRVPLQHLTGVAHFRYLSLAVGPGVFVPRPETEVVVQAVVDELRRRLAEGVHRPRVVDLGTGSGAIAASVAHEVPQARVHAVELSGAAHAWAAENLRGTGAELVRGDLRTAFPELAGRCDVVVSNPPYIPAGAVPREPEAREHDPDLALYGGGEDGLELPRAAVASAVRLLRPGGYFVMEHAEVQAGAVARILAGAGFTGVTGHQDLTGRDRATAGRRPDAATR
ncbi:peptide chain release factor N(5)-glutamine methyltransferase [Kocuria sp. LUK]|uniref:peptide chain release factor N(5)-glutamine methyltransferase n=1 Tax=Kocuria TaxID=57493 RepID=UPI001E5C1CFE|nr:peptide chain release factor N(5)-glutamine methyltransferase [Kocuria sp. LUK]MCD1145682.1 peptide chain release factor N(5)-glutamine methyltransferase [Kocuria sp. LUK]